MATIDPSIAMGYKPIQVENPMNQMAALSQVQNAQNQNALAQYQLSAAQRVDEATNIQNQLYAKHYDPMTGKVNTQGLYGDLAKSPVTAGLIPKLQAQFTELEHKANVNKKVVTETAGLDFKQKIDKQNKALAAIAALDTPAAALADINKHLADGEIDQNQADKLRASIAQAPSFRDWQKSTLLNVLDAKDRLVTEETARANLVREKNAAEQLGVSKGQLGVAQQRLANETNPVLQSTLAGAKKTAELAATDAVSKAKTIEGANQILKDINFNPKTKDNDVSKLIDISTGSYIGKAYDIGNRVFGSATEGSQAIAELKTIESKITTDLLGGKLGAGISNADRDFIQQQVGSISDGTLPVEDRKAAWNRVVTRLNNISSETTTKSNVAPSTPNSATVNIKSNAEYNALPSGTIFVDPNGQQRRKP